MGEEREMAFKMVTGNNGNPAMNSIAEMAAPEMRGQKAESCGMVHAVRSFSKVTFYVLRRRDGIFQCVDGSEGGVQLREGDTVRVKGTVSGQERAPGGFELQLEGVEVLSRAAAPYPVPVNRPSVAVTPETELDLRPVTLRNLKERARFKIQAAIGRAFREYLNGQGFTEIHSPKIGAKGAEGGANIFKLEYFHRPAVLAQSPQFYKQMMVGVFDRVYETGPVFRAEKHSTKRHLNEYTSLDFEMGYIESFEDICAMETGFLQHMREVLSKDCAEEVKLLEIELPKVDEIPMVRFDEAKELVEKEYGEPMRSPYDLTGQEEEMIGRYFKEKCGADFVFVTHYPSKKRPFYAMDDPADKRYTLSFDLLFRGMEVTTGGQRINDYNELLAKIEERGMTTEGMDGYLLAFKCGMPPHGGLGIGLERLTAQLIGLDNVREATLFPRDLNRLEP